MKRNIKRIAREYFLIFVGSVLYAVSTVLFIFPNDLLLGGTSGISVILTAFLPFSPGAILMIINFTLIVFAFAVLGKNMAIKTLVGSVLTTFFVGALERPLAFDKALVQSPYISALVGAILIAIASGIMFFVDSSSGGTDIIALIVRKFSGIGIGKALLLTDILIVLVGGALGGITLLFSSFLGLLVKTLGIDLVIWIIKKIQSDKSDNKEEKKNAC